MKILLLLLLIPAWLAADHDLDFQQLALSKSIGVKPQILTGTQHVFNTRRVFKKLSKLSPVDAAKVQDALEYFIVVRNLRDFRVSAKKNQRRIFGSQQVFIIDMKPGFVTASHSSGGLAHSTPKEVNSSWVMLTQPVTRKDFESKKERKYYRLLRNAGLFKAKSLLKLVGNTSGYRSENSKQKGYLEQFVSKNEKRDLMKISKIVRRGNREIVPKKKRIKSELGLALTESYNKQVAAKN